jgi:gas vesicle protein
MISAKKILSGAAIGTLLGSLATFLYPRRYELIEQLLENGENLNAFTNKARDYGEQLFSRGRRTRRQESLNGYLRGGLLGFAIGATTALFSTPKTGKALRGQLAKAYQGLSEKSEEVIHQFRNNSHPLSVRAVKRRKPAPKRKATRAG